MSPEKATIDLLRAELSITRADLGTAMAAWIALVDAVVAFRDDKDEDRDETQTALFAAVKKAPSELYAQFAARVLEEAADSYDQGVSVPITLTPKGLAILLRARATRIRRGEKP